MAQFVAFPTLVFARGACFIKKDFKIVLANLESFLELYAHSSLHRERERARARACEREDKDREIERGKRRRREREIERVPDDERRKVVGGAAAMRTTQNNTVRDDYL